jgi:hypothetical protein
MQQNAPGGGALRRDRRCRLLCYTSRVKIPGKNRFRLMSFGLSGGLFRYSILVAMDYCPGGGDFAPAGRR